MKATSKFKSFLACCCMFAVVLLCSVAFVGCDKNKPHDHKVADWQIVTEATCQADGQKKGTCTICNEEVTEVIAKLPHTITVIKGTVTCTEDGLSDGEVCSVCGTVIVAQQQVHAPGSHDWGAYEAVPTEDVEGGITYHRRICQRCGEVEEEKCEYTDQVVEPTCTEDGYSVYSCIHCQWTFRHNFVDAKGHNYDRAAYTYVTAEDAEHYRPGKHQHLRQCLNNCGTCLVEECEVGSGEVHEPSCTLNGFTTYTCEKCTHSYDDNIVAQKPHNFGEGWKADIAESYDSNHTHTRTCLDCGHFETAGCQTVVSTTEATCNSPQIVNITCATCSRNDTHEVGEKLTHIYEIKHNGAATKEESKHYQECKLCHDRTEEVACEFTDSVTTEQTCISPEVTQSFCKHCLITYSNETKQSLGHDWDEEHWTYLDDGRCYTTCKNNPEHTKEQAHVFGQAQTIQPDCVTDGSIKKTCEFCEYVSTEVIPALDHEYGDYDVTDEGHIHKCMRAGCQSVLPRVAHQYSETNFCECGYDGLTYKKVDNHYVVLSAAKVRNVNKIIIPETHAEGGEGALPVKGIINAYDGSGLAFSSATIKEVVLPRNLEVIGNNAFKNCRFLRSVSINEDGDPTPIMLKEISLCAFMGCRELVTAHFPESLQIIGDSAFRDCTKLNDIDIKGNVLDIQNRAFDGTAFYNDPDNWTDGVLYISKHLIKANNSQIASEYIVAAETINISVRAFENCTNLTKLTIPGSVKEIDAYAFTGCTALYEVVFTGTFAEWMSIAFVNSDSSPMNFATILTISGATNQIIISEEAGITRIPVGTFRNNTSITSVTIPSTVTEIGEYAFYGCTNLATVIVNGTLKKVGKDAFTNTAFLTSQLALSADGTVYLGNCLITASGKNSEVVVQDGTVSIAAGAFKDGVENITIAASVTFIGANAFTGCTGLKSVLFNNPNGWIAFNVHGIGRGVFAGILNGDESNVSSVLSYVGDWLKDL